MKKLLWIGNRFFSDDLTQFGWEVIFHRLKEPQPLSWSNIQALAGGSPDVLFLSDQSMPTPLIGLESYPCLTVFHCIDSHIHSWYPSYAQAFDLCAVSLKDHLPKFAIRLREQEIIWLPPFARDNDRPRDLPKEWDLLFVGHVNPETTPGRYAFLAELKKICPQLHITTGNYVDLFSRARLVLNYAERKDLNFRVFEALACAACLLTPATGHGLNDFFEDGRDLLLYDQEDLKSLAALVERSLGQPERCRQIGLNGMAKIDAGHRAINRAEQVNAWIRSQPARRLIDDRLRQARSIHDRYLKLIYLHLAENLREDSFRQSYLSAAKAWE